MTEIKINQSERRRFERFIASPMHHGVTLATNDGGEARILEGHAYDISEGGACIEIDERIKPGTNVSVGIHVPPGFDAGQSGEITANGRVVWNASDESEPGPVRMAVVFLSFPNHAQRERLARFLRRGVIRLAA